jgi:hypothetical protein
MPSLASVLICNAYPLADIATLFGLPKWACEQCLGPGLVDSEKLIGLSGQWVAGAYQPFNPALVTDATVAAFQAATLAYALNQFLPGPATYTDAQVAAFFGTTAAAIHTAMGGAGPYTAAAILAATQAGTLTFANITPTTVAAFFAAGG